METVAELRLCHYLTIVPKELELHDMYHQHSQYHTKHIRKSFLDMENYLNLFVLTILPLHDLKLFVPKIYLNLFLSSLYEINLVH